MPIELVIVLIIVGIIVIVFGVAFVVDNLQCRHLDQLVTDACVAIEATGVTTYGHLYLVKNNSAGNDDDGGWRFDREMLPTRHQARLDAALTRYRIKQAYESINRVNSYP